LEALPAIVGVSETEFTLVTETHESLRIHYTRLHCDAGGCPYRLLLRLDVSIEQLADTAILVLEHALLLELRATGHITLIRAVRFLLVRFALLLT